MIWLFDKGPRVGRGDGGGGLVFKDPRTNSYVVRGIASTTARFSEAGPATFVDISYYREWIDKVIEENSGMLETRVE